MQQWMGSPLGTLVALLVVAATLVPGVGAQDAPATESWTLSASTDGLSGPVPPGDTPMTATIRSDWACKQGTVRASGDAEPLTYEATIDQDWASIQLAKTGDQLAVTQAECLNGRLGFSEVDILVTVNESINYGEMATVSFTATLPNQGLTAPVDFVVTAGHFFRGSAKFDQAIFDAKPNQAVVITGTYQNDGNAPIDVFVDVANPGVALDITGPASFPVEAFSEASFTINVLTPAAKGVVDTSDQVSVVLEPKLAGNASSVGEKVTLSAVIKTEQGPVEESPGPGPLLALLALGFVFWRQRRS